MRPTPLLGSSETVGSHGSSWPKTTFHHTAVLFTTTQINNNHN